MTKTLANVRIYGDSDGAVWVADKGTAFPATTSEIAAFSGDWGEVGWISEDGVNVAKETDNSSFTAWQGGKIVRQRVTSETDTFTFQALEENLIVMGLFLPKAGFDTNGAGITRITPAQGVDADERAFGVDFHDGDVHKRYEVIRGEVSARGEVPHQNTEMTIYEFTVTMYEYEIVTNNPALAVE